MRNPKYGSTDLLYPNDDRYHVLVIQESLVSNMVLEDIFEEPATFTKSYVRLEGVKELVQGKKVLNLAFLFLFYFFHF